MNLILMDNEGNPLREFMGHTETVNDIHKQIVTYLYQLECKRQIRLGGRLREAVVKSQRKEKKTVLIQKPNKIKYLSDSDVVFL